MGIQSIEDSKLLRAQGKRLYRDGISERIHVLVMEYATKFPGGNWFEAIKLAGRLHAIALAARADSYWREKARYGFTDELYDLPKFEKSTGKDAGK